MDQTVTVCKAAFLAIHGVKESRLKRKVLNFTVPIEDGRGKHENHKTIVKEIRDRVCDHIKLFPARESHYSRSKNKHKKYLDSSLTVAEMHHLFLKANPDLIPNDCKYWLYLDIFNFEFNIKFGFPRSDICNKCEKFQAQIKAAESINDAILVNKLKFQHELHIKKADVFNVQINEATEAAKLSKDTAVICLDFEKNLLPPLTGIGQEYYKRQLWVHNLCIHDNVNESAHMYLYAEHFAAKGPNEVISCLDHYISGLTSTTTKIVIFMDNCFSQNKNRYIFAYLQRLVNKNVSITQAYVKYPLPGHSRMPCDRNFGRIEKRRRKKDRVILPSQWVLLVKNTDTRKPFNVVYVEHPLTDNMIQDGTPVVKVLDFKRAYDPLIKPVTGISKFRGAKFERGNVPLSRISMTGECCDVIKTFKCGKKLSTLLSLKPNRAYLNFLPVKTAKFHDICDLLTHVNLAEGVTFYSNIHGIDGDTSDIEDIE